MRTPSCGLLAIALVACAKTPPSAPAADTRAVIASPPSTDAAAAPADAAPASDATPAADARTDAARVVRAKRVPRPARGRRDLPCGVTVCDAQGNCWAPSPPNCR